MSDAPTPSAAGPPRVLPVRYAGPPPPPSSGSVWRVFFALVLFASLALNLFLCGGSLMLGSLAGGDHDTESITVRERFHSGSSAAADKVAVVQIEGTSMEGLLGYAHK